ncbi:SocA family protein [Chromobacterium violaceum]|uniref:Panacea domain-containing protein n=1 Tax=Chromobacterium violaceum TaxID=536 RepID=UPI001E5419B6|nr:Panacea domain-containing protein [Chromobacterium violaceum]MCD0493848.1 SocA family protein [Chromobacterium violaceum]
MLIEHEREKLKNAVLFFAGRVRFLGKTKLFKLLYFLDFEHYRDTGRSVTGIEYFAWKMGPVPVELYNEIKQDTTWESCINLERITTAKGHEMTAVRPIGEFQATHFSKRELRIMESLSRKYEKADAEDMVEETHLENLPWHQVYVVDNKKQHHIPYELALRKQEIELMLAEINDRNELVSAIKG